MNQPVRFGTLQCQVGTALRLFARWTQSAEGAVYRGGVEAFSRLVLIYGVICQLALPPTPRYNDQNAPKRVHNTHTTRRGVGAGEAQTDLI